MAFASNVDTRGFIIAVHYGDIMFSLQHVLNIVRRRWWVILAVFLTTLLIAGVLALLYPPRYTSSATLRIKTALRGNLASPDPDEEYTDRLANTLAKIAEAPEFASMLRNQFGLSRAPRVAITIVARTELMEVAVEGPSPALARDMTDFVAKHLLEESKARSDEEATEDRTVLQELANGAAVEQKKAQVVYDAIASQGSKVDLIKLKAAETTLQTASNLYSNQIDRINEVDILRATRKNYVKVQTPAELPASATQPNQLSIFLAGSLLGLLGGIAMAFVAHRLDNRLYDERRVREVSGASLLGGVPTIPNDEGRVQHMGNDAIHLVKTNVLAARARVPFRTLMVTSAMPGEGKTTVALGLAMSLARSGFKVVVIDADLRRPTVHTRMELKNDFGLGNLLASSSGPVNSESEEKALSKALRPTFLNNLYAITSGGVMANPAELLSSSRMQQLLDKLAVSYDFVIVDTPPVLVMPDATALAHRVERLALVSARGTTTEQELARTCDQLASSGVAIMGVIFNRVEWPESYYTYGSNQSVTDDSEAPSAGPLSKRKASIKMHRFDGGSSGSD
jgi:capsular exopolysaccharide synthesis family protein